MTTVDNKKDLKSAIANREDTIVVKGKMAKLLRPLGKLKKPPTNLSSNMTPVAAGVVIAPLVGLSIKVAITLIITVGIVSIVAIINDYYVKISHDEVILEKK